MNLLRNTTILLAGSMLLFAGWTTGCATSSGESVDPFAVADEQRRDILDDEPDVDESARRRARQPEPDDDEMYIIPEAQSDPARTIDATPDGWDMSERRQFRDDTNVYDGIRNWRGADDAGFSAIVDTDDSHAYFWIEVTDDTVVDSSPRDLRDGIVIYLRDPRFDDLLDALPKSLRQALDVRVESAFAINPDGDFAPYNSEEPAPKGAVHTAAQRTDDGYRIEAAFALEAFRYISEMPLTRLAFRIDLYDTDSPHAAEVETRLSAAVDSSGQRPRFAAIDTAGLLPSKAPQQGPPRADVLGVWRFEPEGWRFRFLERMSRRWNIFRDLYAVEEELESKYQLPSTCRDSDNRRKIVEAYEHHSQDRRVALLACGTSARNARCPSGATSQLFWISMERSPDGEQWSVDETRDVFDEPLNQCPSASPAGEPTVHSFSLLPFDAIGPSVWGIGYHKQEQDSSYHLRERNLLLVDPHASDFVLTETLLEREYASGRDQILTDSRVYLTDLDDEEGLDLCTIQSVREQRCDSFRTGCETRSRGHELLTGIELWNQEEYRFEDYILQRHNKCRGSTQFSDITGFKVLILGDRLGLLTSRNGDSTE